MRDDGGVGCGEERPEEGDDADRAGEEHRDRRTASHPHDGRGRGSGGRWARLEDYTLPYLAALFLPPILRGSDCIPVYHDTDVLKTLKKSVRALGEGKNILLFPEHPTGYLTYDKKVDPGFVSLGRLGWARLKKQISFYPVHIDWSAQRIDVGAPIVYDPAVPYADQCSAAAEAVEKFFESFGD